MAATINLQLRSLESHLMPICLYAFLAQLVEHATVNRGVTGSSPVGGARRSVRFRLGGRGLVRREVGSIPTKHW